MLEMIFFWCLWQIVSGVPWIFSDGPWTWWIVSGVQAYGYYRIALPVIPVRIADIVT